MVHFYVYFVALFGVWNACCNAQVLKSTLRPVAYCIKLRFVVTDSR